LRNFTGGIESQSVGEVEPIDWDLFFKTLVIDCGVPPSEIPKLTQPQFIAIIHDPEKKKPQNVGYAGALAYVRQYQKEHFGRKI
jgi:hypothetical protein